MTGNLLEDEKILGTVHVAFGASAAIGGTVNVPVHEDCVVVEPTLTVGSTTVVDAGRFVALEPARGQRLDDARSDRSTISRTRTSRPARDGPSRHGEPVGARGRAAALGRDDALAAQHLDRHLVDALRQPVAHAERAAARPAEHRAGRA